MMKAPHDIQDFVYYKIMAVPQQRTLWTQLYGNFLIMVIRQYTPIG